MKKLFTFSVLVLFVITASYAKENKPKNTEKFQCDKKKYCKHMRSCEEAMFLLNECGLKRLDRDKDGVPCENICQGG